ncbi:penicillin acylase family protein [Paraliomyxa miuraensis]|uniref:penicillin acylase family protein n=1 Tax=Paraliomyxa miuraensis TaxID=376150 RepID=UPI0022591762|nr:penicillin acylase family protein [Paraliomyxa miuraensis]MCX4243027.1 penicillin acylase family protein [Paraliomyxa miuraensis]
MRAKTWILVTSMLAPSACKDEPVPSADGSSTGTTAGSDTSDTSDTGTASLDDTGTSTGGEDIDQFPGLSGPVEILIDERGIPHIYGQADLDVMYASGYQMATDRLFQMDLVRRRALGRQAEVLGPDFVGQDEISRIFDLPRWGAANVDRLRAEDPDTYQLIVAWLAGVNARIEQVLAGEVPLPYGFGPGEADYLPEPWTLQEHSAIAKLMMLGNSNSLERELLATIVQRNLPAAWASIELSRPAFSVPTMPPDELPAPAPWRPGVQHAAKPPIPASPTEIVSALDALHRAMQHIPRVGSNNWAVNGQLTATGRPLIANDPHQPLQSPSLMYAQHLSSVDAGGQIDVIGWAFAGTAGVQLGHNQDLHWAATTNFADVMDIWEVELSGDQVAVGDQMVTMEIRSEVIEVAGEDPQVLEVRDVPGFGVLLPDDIVPLPIAAPGNALLLNWTGFAATAEEQTFVAMAKAATLDEYDAAADTMEVGGFNFVAATADGITYRVNVHVPDRGDPSARPMPFLVVDGNDPESLWSGQFLPPEQMPRSRAESRGWIATANNDPWGFTFDGDVSNDPWYYGYFFASGFRAQRIDEELTRLANLGGISLEDMQALQTDTHSTASDLLLPILEQAWSNLGVDPELAPYEGRPELQTLYSLLTDTWDQRMERDSPGALVFHLYLMMLTDEVVRDELSFLYNIVLEAESPFVVKIPILAMLDQYPDSAALLGASRDVVALETLSRVASLLEAFYGDVDPSGYTWGDMHGTDFTNPLGGDLYGGWWPSDGGEDTVNVSSSAFLDENGNVAERFDSHDGGIFRVVTTFAEDGTPQAYCNFPPGNSADPGSPHFDDTREAWLEDQYTFLPFERDEVEAVTEQTIVLEP